LDAIVIEWGSLLLRWLHVTAGIAWVGASFYFMHIDAAMRPRAGMAPELCGAAWEVHGGGFYEVRKYLVAPPELPPALIWHKWQAYTTFLSGFALLVLLYYGNAGLYLIDPERADLSTAAAAAIGTGSLVLGWLCYDALCRSPLARHESGLAAAAFVFVVAMTWGFQQVFSGRGALVHAGAMMGTMMVANVFLVIIPNQRKIIADLVAGRTPDPSLGAEGKIRSTHNNYLTLPTLFLMLSPHAPLTFSTPFAFVIVALVLIAGAAVRHYYNLRHAGRDHPLWTPAWVFGLAAACMLAAAAVSLTSAPAGREQLGLGPLPDPAAVAGAVQAPRPVTEIVTSRCSMCHAREPVWPGIAIAPRGMLLDSPEAIARNRDAIRAMAVDTAAMPPNNVTGMTIRERRVLAAWVRGARGTAHTDVIPGQHAETAKRIMTLIGHGGVEREVRGRDDVSRQAP